MQPSALRIGGLGIWAGMPVGGIAALTAGPALTVFLRVRLVPVEIRPILLR